MEHAKDEPRKQQQETVTSSGVNNNNNNGSSTGHHHRKSFSLPSADPSTLLAWAQARLRRRRARALRGAIIRKEDIPGNIRYFDDEHDDQYDHRMESEGRTEEEDEEETSKRMRRKRAPRYSVIDVLTATGENDEKEEEGDDALEDRGAKRSSMATTMGDHEIGALLRVKEDAAERKPTKTRLAAEDEDVDEIFDDVENLWEPDSVVDRIYKEWRRRKKIREGKLPPEDIIYSDRPSPPPHSAEHSELPVADPTSGIGGVLEDSGEEAEGGQKRRGNSFLESTQTCLFLSSSPLTSTLAAAQLRSQNWNVYTATRVMDVAAAFDTRVKAAEQEESARTARGGEEKPQLGGNNATREGKPTQMQQQQQQGGGFKMGEYGTIYSSSPQRVNGAKEQQGGGTCYNQSLVGNNSVPCVVIVDALTHETHEEILKDLRFIELRYRLALCIVLIPRPRPAEGRGVKLTGRDILSVTEGYQLGYDLVFDSLMDYSVVEVLSNMFISEASRRKKIEGRSSQHVTSNYLHIRTLLSDVTDRFFESRPEENVLTISSQPTNGKSSNRKEGEDQLEDKSFSVTFSGVDDQQQIRQPAHNGDDVDYTEFGGGPDCIDSHPQYVIVLSRYEKALEKLKEYKEKLDENHQSIVKFEERVRALEKEKFSLTHEVEGLRAAIPAASAASTAASKDRAELLRRKAIDSEKIKSLEAQLNKTRDEQKATHSSLEAKDAQLTANVAELRKLKRESQEAQKKIGTLQNAYDVLQKRIREAKNSRLKDLLPSVVSPDGDGMRDATALVQQRGCQTDDTIVLTLPTLPSSFLSTSVSDAEFNEVDGKGDEDDDGQQQPQHLSQKGRERRGGRKSPPSPPNNGGIVSSLPVDEELQRLVVLMKWRWSGGGEVGKVMPAGSSSSRPVSRLSPTPTHETRNSSVLGTLETGTPEGEGGGAVHIPQHWDDLIMKHQAKFYEELSSLFSRDDGEFLLSAVRRHTVSQRTSSPQVGSRQKSLWGDALAASLGRSKLITQQDDDDDEVVETGGGAKKGGDGEDDVGGSSSLQRSGRASTTTTTTQHNRVLPKIRGGGKAHREAERLSISSISTRSPTTQERAVAFSQKHVEEEGKAEEYAEDDEDDDLIVTPRGRNGNHRRAEEEEKDERSRRRKSNTRHSKVFSSSVAPPRSQEAPPLRSSSVSTPPTPAAAAGPTRGGKGKHSEYHQHHHHHQPTPPRGTLREESRPRHQERSVLSDASPSYRTSSRYLEQRDTTQKRSLGKSIKLPSNHQRTVAGTGSPSTGGSASGGGQQNNNIKALSHKDDDALLGGMDRPSPPRIAAARRRMQQQIAISSGSVEQQATTNEAEGGGLGTGTAEYGTRSSSSPTNTSKGEVPAAGVPSRDEIRSVRGTCKTIVDDLHSNLGDALLEIGQCCSAAEDKVRAKVAQTSKLLQEVLRFYPMPSTTKKGCPERAEEGDNAPAVEKLSNNNESGGGGIIDIDCGDNLRAALASWERKAHSLSDAMESCFLQSVRNIQRDDFDPIGKEAKEVALKYAVLYFRHSKVMDHIQTLEYKLGQQGEEERRGFEHQLATLVEVFVGKAGSDGSLSPLSEAGKFLEQGDLQSFAETVATIFKVYEKIAAIPRGSASQHHRVGEEGDAITTTATTNTIGDPNNPNTDEELAQTLERFGLALPCTATQFQRLFSVQEVNISSTDSSKEACGDGKGPPSLQSISTMEGLSMTEPLRLLHDCARDLEEYSAEMNLLESTSFQLQARRKAKRKRVPLAAGTTTHNDDHNSDHESVDDDDDDDGSVAGDEESSDDDDDTTTTVGVPLGVEDFTTIAGGGEEDDGSPPQSGTGSANIFPRGKRKKKRGGRGTTTTTARLWQVYPLTRIVCTVLKDLQQKAKRSIQEEVPAVLDGVSTRLTGMIDEIEKFGINTRLYDAAVDLRHVCGSLLSPNGYVELTPQNIVDLYKLHHRQVLRLLRQLKERTAMYNINLTDVSQLEKQLLKDRYDLRKIEKESNTPLQIATDTAFVARFADYFEAETMGQWKTGTTRFKKKGVSLLSLSEAASQTDYVVPARRRLSVSRQQQPHSISMLDESRPPPHHYGHQPLDDSAHGKSSSMNEEVRAFPMQQVENSNNKMGSEEEQYAAPLTSTAPEGIDGGLTPKDHCLHHSPGTTTHGGSPHSIPFVVFTTFGGKGDSVMHYDELTEGGRPPLPSPAAILQQQQLDSRPSTREAPSITPVAGTRTMDFHPRTHFDGPAPRRIQYSKSNGTSVSTFPQRPILRAPHHSP